MNTKNETTSGKQPSCLWRIVRLCALWPRNDTTRRNTFPWWLIALRAPFVAASIVALYTAAVVCALLALGYNPSRAAEIFDRIRNA